MVRGRRLSLAAALALLLGSCRSHELDTFLRLEVPDASLVLTDTIYLAATEQITTGWVYRPEGLIGVISVPGRLPVHCEGDSVTLTFRAGVRRNGQSADQAMYPFYMPAETTVACMDTTYIKWLPPVRYYPTSQIAVTFREGFEYGARVQVESGSGWRQQTTVRSGQWAYLFQGPAESTLRTDTFRIGPPGKASFVEIDYQATGNFAVAAYIPGVAYPHKPILTVYATGEEWKKLYIDLTPLSSEAQDKALYLVFSFTADSSGVQKLYLDNLKVLVQR